MVVMDSAMSGVQEAAKEVQRAKAVEALKVRELQAAEASKNRVEASKNDAAHALEVARARAEVAEAETAEAEALAVAQMGQLVEHVLEAVFQGMLFETAERQQQEMDEAELRMKRLSDRGQPPNMKVMFDSGDVPTITTQAVQLAAPAGAATGRSLLHDVLGSHNVLRVRFQEEARGCVAAAQRKAREQRVLVQGLLFNDRRFRAFAFKEDDEGSYAFVAEEGRAWHPFTGVVSWSSVVGARQIFADFENVPQLAKYTMRPSLLLSQSVDLRTPSM